MRTATCTFNEEGSQIMAKSITVNGNTYNDSPYDAATNPDGLANGGWRVNSKFITMLLDTLADASSSLQDTSTTSNDIGTGNKTFTLTTGRPIPDGGIYAFAIDQDNSANWMWGEVTDNTNDVITLNVSVTNGTGVGLANWLIQPTGPQGAAGSDGSDYWDTALTAVNNANGAPGTPFAAADRDVIECDLGSGPIEVQLPATGRVAFKFKNAPDDTNFLRVTPPSGESIFNQTANDTLKVTKRVTGFALYRSGTNWS